MSESWRVSAWQIATVLAVYGVVGGLYYALWERPRGASLWQHGRELASMQVSLGEAHGRETMRGSLLVEIEGLEARLGRSNSTVAEESRPSTSEFLERVERLAERTHLVVRGYTPQDVERMNGVTVWPIRIELVGSYNAICVFVGEVSTLAPLVETRDIVIESLHPPPDPLAVRAELTVASFTHGDGTAAATTAFHGGSVGGRSPACRDSGGSSRDPFSRPAPSREEPIHPALTRRPPGLAGVRTTELSLDGLGQSGAGRFALVHDRERRSYVLRGAERLFDGVVQEVAADAVVFRADAGAHTVRLTRVVTGRSSHVNGGGQ